MNRASSETVPPVGTVTFLFTDIEGSTSKWEQYQDAMSLALPRHDEILRSLIQAHRGYVFKTVGDAFCAAFGVAVDAVNAAVAAHRALQDADWGKMGSLQIRVGIHTGAAEERGGDYFGQPLNRVARLMSAGHGGQTLLSQSAYELIRDQVPASLELRDLGEHRLKDLIRPEHIYQVVAGGLPAAFATLKTLDYHPNNLPVQPTPLIGREKELDTLQKLLKEGAVRLVTLTGPGGMGKTRIALQLAAEVLDGFKDGVWFTNLAPITESNLVVPTIAQVLGVKEVGERELTDTLKGYLKEKQLLLFLDNFEQVIDAATIISELLAYCPHLRVLVTSRIALRLRGEHEYSVPPLRLPNPKPLPSLDSLTQYEAVRLFIERARGVKSDFEVNNDNAPAVAEICARLDGLPLAIELAAVRVRLLPPQAILSRLEHRLTILTGGSKDLPARQQTIRNTIEWSYDLLDEGEKQFFRRIAVFHGGRTLEGLEAICNFDEQLQVDVLDGVESLVSKSLLQQRERRDGEPYFWMLETIQEYAREKLAERGEVGQLRAEHAIYFMALAEKAEPYLKGPEQQRWLDNLEEELDNLRAALRWARESTIEDTIIGLRTAGALWQFWLIRGYISEGRKQLEDLIVRARNGDNGVGDLQSAVSAPLARALMAAARLVLQQGDFLAGEALGEESVRLGTQVGDNMTVAMSLLALGNAALHRGDNSTARSLYERKLALSRALGDKWNIAESLDRLGMLAKEDGDYATARSLSEQSLALRSEIGDKMSIAWSLSSLGILAFIERDYSKARSLFEECLNVHRELRNRADIPYLLGNLGNVAFMQGDYLSAYAQYKEALLIAQEIVVKYVIAWTLTGLGAAAAGLGEAQRGAILLGGAESMLEAIGGKLEVDDSIIYKLGLEMARNRLGEEGFGKAWQEGRAMSLEQAIGYA